MQGSSGKTNAAFMVIGWVLNCQLKYAKVSICMYVLPANSGQMQKFISTEHLQNWIQNSIQMPEMLSICCIHWLQWELCVFDMSKKTDHKLWCLITDYRCNLNPVWWNGKAETEIKGDRISLQLTKLGKFENDNLSKHDLKDKYDWKVSKIIFML